MSGVLRIESWDDVPRSSDAGAVLLELDGSLPGSAAPALRRLARLDVPIVCSLAGSGDATLLAAALVSSYASASPTLTVDCSGVRSVLELGLSWPLVHAGAQRLLFSVQPLTAERLAAAGLAEVGGDAAAAAERLAADPHAPLLVRSVRAAQRTNARGSAEYDAELTELA